MNELTKLEQMSLQIYCAMLQESDECKKTPEMHSDSAVKQAILLLRKCEKVSNESFHQPTEKQAINLQKSK